MSAPIWLLVGLILGAGIGALVGWLLTHRRRTEEHHSAVMHLTEELAQAKALVTSAESAKAELQKYHDSALAQMRDTFRATSTEVLQKLHPDFITLARGELGQKEQAIAALVKPLQEHLEKFENRHSQSFGFLGKHLETLALETQQLRRILNNSQARGRWGELTLRRIIEAAELSPHCDFIEQPQVGEIKPDLVVKLPGGRCIVVDAKVPDLDFLAGIDGVDDTTRGEALKAHAKKVRMTIDDLSSKDYTRRFPNALDYVVLFLPAESLFSTALEGDPELIAWAAKRQVLLTTPASLLGLLRCIHISWQQHAQTENARLIAQSASELYTRICKFIEHFDRLRASLDKANLAYNEAVASYSRMVRPSGERLVKLGIDTVGRDLPDISPIGASIPTFSLEQESTRL